MKFLFQFLHLFRELFFNCTLCFQHLFIPLQLLFHIITWLNCLYLNCWYWWLRLIISLNTLRVHQWLCCFLKIRWIYINSRLLWLSLGIAHELQRMMIGQPPIWPCHSFRSTIHLQWHIKWTLSATCRLTHFIVLLSFITQAQVQSDDFSFSFCKTHLHVFYSSLELLHLSRLFLLMICIGRSGSPTAASAYQVTIGEISSIIR